jgi:hypothetical protein
MRAHLFIADLMNEVIGIGNCSGAQVTNSKRSVEPSASFSAPS